MMTLAQPGGENRPILSLLHIRSPLTRVGYTIPEDNGCLLILFAGAVDISAEVRPGAEDISVEGQRLLWLPAGQARELRAAAGARGMILLASRQTLVRALPASLLAEQVRQVIGQGLSLTLGESQPIVRLVEGVAEEKRIGGPGSREALENYLGLVLLYLWRLLGAELVTRSRSPQGLAERFLMLAGLHKHQHWTVEQYAQALGVSRDRLGVAVRRATEISPQAYLHREIMRDACELLASTGLPVSQIAFRLGFADPAYFNRFFTRQSGQTPGRYRHVLRERKEKGDLTYAAWP